MHSWSTWVVRVRKGGRVVASLKLALKLYPTRSYFRRTFHEFGTKQVSNFNPERNSKLFTWYGNTSQRFHWSFFSLSPANLNDFQEFLEIGRVNFKNSQDRLTETFLDTRDYHDR